MDDEYGLYDNMKPDSAIMTAGGATVAVCLTTPPSKYWTNPVQAIHLLKLFQKAPGDIMEVYRGKATSFSA